MRRHASRTVSLDSHCVWLASRHASARNASSGSQSVTPSSIQGGGGAGGAAAEGTEAGEGDARDKAASKGESIGTRGNPPARLSFTGYVLVSASPQSIAEAKGEGGEGGDEGMHDESLQLPFFSVLNSCTAHQAFSSSHMNLQSDAHATRGGSWKAYQSFMPLCSCTWGEAKSLQLPLSSALNLFPTHQDLAHPFSQANRQSDALAARGGS